MEIYSCATAHDLHVIPSWPPHFRAGPAMAKYYKELILFGIVLTAPYQFILQKYQFFFKKNLVVSKSVVPLQCINQLIH